MKECTSLGCGPEPLEFCSEGCRSMHLGAVRLAAELQPELDWIRGTLLEQIAGFILRTTFFAEYTRHNAELRWNEGHTAGWNDAVFSAEASEDGEPQPDETPNPYELPKL